jgi:hypothetical protein
MEQWEYLVVQATVDLNALGTQGWELVAVIPARDGIASYYLKRPAPSFRDHVTLDQKRRYYGLLGIPMTEDKTDTNLPKVLEPSGGSN